MRKLRMDKNRITLVSIGVIILCFSIFNLALASEITSQSIIDLVNKSRTESNINSLEENERLNQAAQDKLKDMIEKKYFAHTSPEGITPWHWIEKNGYDYQYAGENLALGFSSVESEHKAWMNSPTHKKNILNPNYKDIGIAVGSGVIDGKMVTIAVQEFGALSGNSENNLKEENNIPDNNSKDLLEQNKKNGQGIVLNTGSSNGDLFGGKPAGQGINSGSFAKFKNWIADNEEMLVKYMWSVSIAILVFLFASNAFIALSLMIHYIVHRLRKTRYAFMLTHSIIMLFLVGSLVLGEIGFK